jgi:hypothetical protein
MSKAKSKPAFAAPRVFVCHFTASTTQLAYVSQYPLKEKTCTILDVLKELISN